MLQKFNPRNLLWAVTFPILVLAVAMVGSRNPADASVWYVDNQVGQDTNSGLTATIGGAASGPFRTIGRALEAAYTGDTIVLAKTAIPYSECISLVGARHSGLPGLPFRIVGNGAILSGTTTTPPRDWELIAPDLFRFRPQDAAFQQIFLNARPATFEEHNVQSVAKLQPKAWSLIDGNVYFKTEANQLPDAYNLSHAYHQVGITLYRVEHVSIENLIVQGYWQDGINAHDNVWNSQLVGVTSRGNGRSGVSVGGCSRVQIQSCLLGDNLQSQLRTETVAKVELLGSSVLDNGVGKKFEKLGGKIIEVAAVENLTQ